MDSRGRLSLREFFRRLRWGKPRLYRSDRSFSVSVVVERRAIQRHAVQGRIGPVGNAQPYGVHQSQEYSNSCPQFKQTWYVRFLIVNKAVRSR
jgi:hypothetical protein